MSDDIPFTTFYGQIKQIETNFRSPIMADFFNPCFSAFEDLNQVYASLKSAGIDQIFSAAGVEFNFGYRPKRFAGGPGLPPGRYFTICEGGSFNDYGTLRDEITAYYSPSSGLTVRIFDPKVDNGVLDYLRTSGLSEDDLTYPLYLLIYRIERRTEKNAHLFERNNSFKEGESFAITYGVRQFERQISKVIDLRDPETQDWFIRTFVKLELEGEKGAAEETKVHFLPKEAIENFGDMLRVIVSLETGGGMIFGQAVGHWLRQHGANALIFPSARSNAFSKVSEERVVSSRGWNMVVYEDAEEPVDLNFFGRMATWWDSDHDHIKIHYTSEGLDRGSLSIRGLREFNLLDFDLGQQVSSGVRKENPISQITGLYNEYISRTVNSILEDETTRQELWDNDIDYLHFLDWLENRWRS